MGKLNFEALSLEDFKNKVHEEIQKSEFEEICLPNIICNIFIGLSKNLISTLCTSLKIPNELPKENITIAILENIYNNIMRTLKSASENSIKFLMNENKKDYTFDFVSNTGAPEFAENSYFLDEFYSQKENVSLLKSAKSNLQRDINSHISKITKKLNLVLKNLDEEPNLEKYKQYGDLISCNIYRMDIGMTEKPALLGRFFERVKIPVIANQ